MLYMARHIPHKNGKGSAWSVNNFSEQKHRRLAKNTIIGKKKVIAFGKILQASLFAVSKYEDNNHAGFEI